MNPFIVFGDSITYGAELADVPYEKPKTDPSKFAWPALLGGVNFAYPGLSNFGIRRLCINFSTFHRPDYVIVAWSYNDRTEFLQAESIIGSSPYVDDTKECDKLFTTIGPDWKEDIKKQGKQFVDLYYKYFYNDYSGIYNTLSNIYFTQLHLESLNLNYSMTFPSYRSLCVDDEYIFNLFVDNPAIDAVIGSIEQLYELIDWTKFIFMQNTFSDYGGIMDLATEHMPHGHPTQECHNKYADELRRRIF